jgi:hypothetical protein
LASRGLSEWGSGQVAPARQKVRYPHFLSLMTVTDPITDPTWPQGLLPTAQRRSASAVRFLLGSVLLITAGLKLYGLSATAFARVAWLVSPQVQIVTAGWELVLGFWLLSGFCRTSGWLATVGTFVAFAMVSGYFGWTGSSTCDCFGSLAASPWNAFALDVGALLLLAVARPAWGIRSGLPFFSWVAIPTSAASLLIGVAGVGSMIYGSPHGALARLRGEALTASSEFIDLGDVAPGDLIESSIEVRNWTDGPVRLTGTTSDCSCVGSLELPLGIAKGESRRVTISVNVPRSKPGTFSRVVHLLTDDPDGQKVRLEVGWRVIERAEP